MKKMKVYEWAYMSAIAGLSAAFWYSARRRKEIEKDDSKEIDRLKAERDRRDRILKELVLRRYMWDDKGVEAILDNLQGRVCTIDSMEMSEIIGDAPLTTERE